MLIYHRTSLLESKAQTVVNTVNCVGVMGKGIAAEFKARYPDMFAAYKRICDAGALEPGKLWLWQGPERWVLNFPTKNHWRNPSRLEWIEAGLEKFVAEHERRGITEISFPRLGCGNGGLDWDEVRPIMEKHLAPLSITVYIHDYTHNVGLPEHLEALAQQISSTVEPVSTFESFISALESAIHLSNGQLVDIDTKENFTARMSNGELYISTNTQSRYIESDDLYGLWLSLTNGLVTREKAAWAAGEAAEPVLSLLTVVPGTRAVQIQRRKSEPEIAVEMKPRFGSENVLGRPNNQYELSWH